MFDRSFEWQRSGYDEQRSFTHTGTQIHSDLAAMVEALLHAEARSRLIFNLISFASGSHMHSRYSALYVLSIFAIGHGHRHRHLGAYLLSLFAPLPYNHALLGSPHAGMSFIIWSAKVICGIRYETRGFENFPDGPVIVLSKHQSAWETIFLLMATPRPSGVCLQEIEITYIPFFGWAISLMRMIPIDRSKGKDAFAQVVTIGRKRLADGQWVIMFPEGTRIPVGQKGNYKGGGTRLAIETQYSRDSNCASIPVNAGRKIPSSKNRAPITVSVGKPIAS